MSGDDFLADLGYGTPDEVRAKILLSNTIAVTIEDCGLSLAEASDWTGLPQKDLERIVDGDVTGYSAAQLTKAARAFEHAVVG